MSIYYGSTSPDNIDSYICFAYMMDCLYNFVGYDDYEDDEGQDGDYNIWYFDWANENAHTYNPEYRFLRPVGDTSLPSKRKVAYPDTQKWGDTVVKFYCDLLPRCLSIDEDSGFLRIAPTNTGEVASVLWALHDIRKISEWPGIALLVQDLVDHGLPVQDALSYSYGVLVPHARPTPEHNVRESTKITCHVDRNYSFCHLLGYPYNPKGYADVFKGLSEYMSGTDSAEPSTPLSCLQEYGKEHAVEVFGNGLAQGRRGFDGCYLAQLSGTSGGYLVGSYKDVVRKTVKHWKENGNA